MALGTEEAQFVLDRPLSWRVRLSMVGRFSVRENRGVITIRQRNILGMIPVVVVVVFMASLFLTQFYERGLSSFVPQNGKEWVIVFAAPFLLYGLFHQFFLLSKSRAVIIDRSKGLVSSGTWNLPIDHIQYADIAVEQQVKGPPVYFLLCYMKVDDETSTDTIDETTKEPMVLPLSLSTQTSKTFLLVVANSINALTEEKKYVEQRFSRHDAVAFFLFFVLFLVLCTLLVVAFIVPYRVFWR